MDRNVRSCMYIAETVHEMLIDCKSEIKGGKKKWALRFVVMYDR